MIPAFRFFIEHIIKGALVCDVATEVVKTMVTKLTVHAVANVVELFMQTIVDITKDPVS